MYLGNDLQVAFPTYRAIDDISASFNGVTTSFALLVGGVAPVPQPLNAYQCLISIAGVVQKPDPTGSSGFNITGGNIVFSSAPTFGQSFFGVILAGADYVNVGANFPSGTAAVPSITFDSDLDTGIYNSAANQISFATAGVERLRIDSAGQIESVSLGTAAAPAFSFTTDPNTGIYSPGADTVAISTNGDGRLFIDSTGRVGIGTSSAAAGMQLAAFGSQMRTGANTFMVPAGNAFLSVNSVGGQDNWIGSNGGGYNQSTGSFNILLAAGHRDANEPAGSFIGSTRTGVATHETIQIGHMLAGTTNSSKVPRLTINSSGNVGIGTTSPGYLLDVSGSGDVANFSTTSFGGVRLSRTNAVGNGSTHFQLGFYNSDSFVAGLTTINTSGSSGSTGTNYRLDISGGNSIAFSANAAEHARIDSSGRLLVGTSTARANLSNSTLSAQFQIEGTSGTSRRAFFCSSEASAAGFSLILGHQRSGTIGGNTILNSGDTCGVIAFQGSDGAEFVDCASIASEVDGTPGANDMPGRLVFSTTADGASSPTERMRITGAGTPGVHIGNTGFNVNAVGVSIGASGAARGLVEMVRDSADCLRVSRLTNDGTIVSIRQDTSEEGSISVSGTTVSYNGAHLSRWSQLSGVDPYDKTVRPEILRGTVMSNLDEMCDWTCPTSGDCQDNEQLNKTKISDVEGDKNVAGVFQGWDDDDDTWVNDYYLAMTGDFIIRIAAGVTVERGDLLMSAGDGTAKPQDDDIIRSKTIAKVTSTTVSCTYDDGSYCVPCVLMAC